MDDVELIQRWQQGDRAAFEALVRQWQQPIARFLFRMVGEAEAVQDLCQEVFLRVYHATERYRENGAFSAWLYRIALNVARDAARKRAFPATLAVEPLSTGSSAEEDCARSEMASHLSRAISRLPEPMRVAIALRHDEGLSFEEIARMTGVAASTWKSRFASALHRLREDLEQLGYSPEELPE